MDGEPQLFGAPPLPTQECVLHVTPPRNGQRGRVCIQALEPMHKRPMELLVQGLLAEQMATTVGTLVPIVLAAHWKSPQALRSHFWAAFRVLGIAGREVAINGCGRPPK